MTEAVLTGFEPTPKQLHAARACLDPSIRVVACDGSIRSGKTQVCARVLLEWAVEQPTTYLVARATYRSLKDSTEKAMLHGDGGLPPLIPPELVAQYRASDELVKLRSGGEILFRSLEEGNLGKILNLSLVGVLVDQIEELDPGDAGERVFDTLVSKHAPEILRRRHNWWEVHGESNTCWADPSIFARHGLSDRLGRPALIAAEYADYGIGLSPANNDRKAGYLRLCELLHVDPKRFRPSWAPVMTAVVGAPRLFVFTTCRHLIEQFRSAPVAAEGLDAGEIVDPRWATGHGHAVDAARYGAMSRPSPSDEPGRDPTLEDPRAEALRQSYLHECELDEVREFDAWEDSLYG
jgi:hypothetical protein